jgi:hypothetical protein
MRKPPTIAVTYLGVVTPLARGHPLHAPQVRVDVAHLTGVTESILTLLFPYSLSTNIAT